MKSYVIHLIRQGLTEANSKGMYIGKTDLPLIDASKKELEKMRKSGEYPTVEAVFSSPLLRCTETAEILYPSREIITVEEMREYDFGDFEGHTGEELDGRPDYTAWVSGKMAPPNGESNEDFIKRLCVGLNSVVRTMMDMGVHSAALVMHGGAMMMLLAACGLPRHKSVDWTCASGEGFSIRVTPSLYQRTGAVEVFDTVPSTAEYSEDDNYD